MKEKQITVLKVEPHKHPEVCILENDLDSLQKAVSIGADYQGLIEIFGIDDDVAVLSNEEAKLIGLEPNLDSFIVGFRLGAKFTYDTFVSTESPFQDLLKE